MLFAKVNKKIRKSKFANKNVKFTITDIEFVMQIDGYDWSCVLWCKMVYIILFKTLICSNIILILYLYFMVFVDFSFQNLYIIVDFIM